uniref:CUB domain-containing protein n=1 Tax=Rhabditophanes sp. KR3021 TaxID=114890 RepID=A0AC35TWQ5_9BILA
MNCHFRITTDPKYKIKIIVSTVKVASAKPCVVGKGLEVKFLNDMTNSGAAFCGSTLTTPKTPKIMISARNLVMIHYPGVVATNTFTLTYQRVA